MMPNVIFRTEQAGEQPARAVGLEFWRFCFDAKHSAARNQEPKNYKPLSEK